MFLSICIMISGCVSKDLDSKVNTVKKDDSSSFVVTSYGSDLKKHDYIYPRHPKKVVALWQNSVETLIALGAVDKIIAFGGLANENYLKPEHREAFEKIPIRSRQVFSQESVLLMEPDFILGWYFDFSGKGRSIGTTDFWNKRHVNVYMNLLNGAEFQPTHTLEDEIKYIKDVGRIVGKETQAENIIHNITERIGACKNRLSLGRKPKVLIISSIGSGVSIYTPRTLPGDLVTQLGGIVLGKENEKIGENETISLEEILINDPDVVFISSSPEYAHLMLEKFKNIPALRSLHCIRNNSCYIIPFYTIRSPGVRVVDAIEIFASGLTKASVSS
ncbi:ABC transporter substrate-binding protein [uncultured Phascolarctobacterium sp.]|uniref:ABC transporter substrate-binding protein n=1 Tax=uncultured Phascolarctobacterium sp. TaxID=512296 RepID=UPI0025E1D761|nr:ABC transporter substrate-binding protein [uncultured Phascolarctobacterium sp.]